MPSRCPPCANHSLSLSLSPSQREMPSSADAGPVRHKASKANKAKQSKLPIIDALKADPKVRRKRRHWSDRGSELDQRGSSDICRTCISPFSSRQGFVMRYRTGLMLQTRVKQGKPFTNLSQRAHHYSQSKSHRARSLSDTGPRFLLSLLQTAALSKALSVFSTLLKNPPPRLSCRRRTKKLVARSRSRRPWKLQGRSSDLNRRSRWRSSRHRRRRP